MLLNSAPAANHPISRKRQIRIYKLLLSLAGLIVGLAIAEGALRIIERVQLGDRAVEDKLIKDPILGFKLAPYTQGHDAKGFRNDVVPQHAEIVCLGDSQTWGVNVERQDAWPQQLSKISGRSVSSMAFGGFGPVQYQVLSAQALRLSPELIAVGLDHRKSPQRAGILCDSVRRQRQPGQVGLEAPNVMN